MGDKELRYCLGRLVADMRKAGWSWEQIEDAWNESCGAVVMTEDVPVVVHS